MRNNLGVIAKSLVLGVVTLAVQAFGQGVARADEVFIEGYTNGCFNCVTPINADGPQAVTLFGLSLLLLGTGLTGIAAIAAPEEESARQD